MSKKNGLDGKGNNNEVSTGGGKLKRELGLAAATAIVVGNTIGSGIFMAPQQMADAANPKATIAAWIITAIGFVLIALSFANLGSKMPKTGGPIVYSREAFGDFAGFLIAWTYWIGAWVGNAAIITGFMRYFRVLVPGADNAIVAFLICSAVLWIFTIVNLIGVKQAGIVGIITTILKILPLIVFAILAAIKFDPSLLSTVSGDKAAGWGTLPVAIGLALWSFVGIESATIAAGEVKNPEKNIKKSTILGTLAAAGIYIIISVLAMGVISQKDLAGSEAPLADIINFVTGGTWGGKFIAIGVVISTLGATSGWILTTARSAFAGAEDKLFPAFFGKVHPRFKTPHVSLIISGILANLLLVVNYVVGYTKGFDFMILLASLAFLPAYAFTAAAEIVLFVKHSADFNLFNFIKNSFISLVAFGFCIYAIYATGAETVMYGFILMLIGIPFYVYKLVQNNKAKTIVVKAEKSTGIDA